MDFQHYAETCSECQFVKTLKRRFTVRNFLVLGIDNF